MRLPSLLSLAFLFAVPAAWPAAAQQQIAPEELAARKAAVGKVLETSYTRASGEAWRKMLATPDATPDCQCSDDAAKQQVNAAWLKAVEAFDAKALEADVGAALVANVSAAHIARWSAFYESELGRRIHTAENPAAMSAGSEQEQMMELQRSSQLLERNPKRKRALGNLAKAARALETTVDALINTSLGSALGTTAAMPDGQPRPETDEVVAMCEEQRPMMTAAISAIMAPSMERIYRAFSVDEIDMYADELSSPHAESLTKAFQTAFADAIKKQAIAIGTAFAKELKATKI